MYSQPFHSQKYTAISIFNIYANSRSKIEDCEEFDYVLKVTLNIKTFMNSLKLKMFNKFKKIDKIFT